MQDSEGFTIVQSKGRATNGKVRKNKALVGGDLSSGGDCLAAKDIVSRIRRLESSFASGSSFAEACWSKIGPVVGERRAWLRCRGIGCVGRSEQAQLQCAFALFLQARLGDEGKAPEFMEPLLVEAEKEALQELGFDMGGGGRGGAQEAENRVLEVLYCPHAPAGLYHTELQRRWSVEQLALTVVIGNSFGSYAVRLPKGRAPLLALTEPFVSEESLPNNPLASTTFNDTAIHSFARAAQTGLPPLSPEHSDHHDPEFIA